MKRGFFVFVVFLIYFVGLLFWPGTQKKTTQIDVLSGSTAHSVLRSLQKEEVLKWRLPFLVWTKIRDAGSQIKVGRYQISHRRSAFWIVDDLINGRTQKIRLVIPEGFASWQIAERLDKSLICDGDAFLKHVREKGLEGFLYPATYDLDLGLDHKVVAQFLKAEFDKRWTLDLDERAAMRGWTKRETVTMASIIEREVMIRDELPDVSALYNNRLRKGMRLEADPTVQYALGYWKSRLFYSDYRKTISPYNTYLNKGIPPGPICSPGMDAIRAALWPARSNALYMVAKEDGWHDFSTNLRDHINKVNRRNRKRREKNRSS